MSVTARLAGVGPATRYARSGQVHVAHQVLGSGPPDLVLVPGFVSHVEAAWDWPYLARFLYRLASFGQLVMFDKRGTGLSDPMKRPPTLDERVDDIRAVMDAVGVERAHLFGVSEGGALSIAFAAQLPASGRVADSLRVLPAQGRDRRLPVGRVASDRRPVPRSLR